MNIEALLPKLPLIVGWIDKTLAEHAAQARPVASFRFSRLPDFYSKNLLDRTKVIIVPKVPTPPLSALGFQEFAAFEKGTYNGITFKDTYFLTSSHAMNESIHFHELVHVVQWAHLGVERFLLAYAAGLIEKGYRDSPLEVMAYDLQDRFDRNEQTGSVENLVRTKLDEQFRYGTVSESAS